jgi:hypothetical protein
MYLGKNKNAQGTIENISQARRMDRRGVQGRTLNSDLPPAEDYSAIQGKKYSMAEALYVACIQKRWVALGDSQDTLTLENNLG